jgi:dihydroorotase
VGKVLRTDCPSSYDPPFSLLYCMSELMALGLPLSDVLKMVTCNAAEIVRQSGDLGSLSVGQRANVSVLELERGEFIFHDSLGKSVKGGQRLRSKFLLKNGKQYFPDSPLLPQWERRTES